jgi:hypothetical protein
MGPVRKINALAKIGPIAIGYTQDWIGYEDCPYMNRWILWFGLGTLRVHRFMRDDEDRDLHDHPWAFVTIPLQTYHEAVTVSGEASDSLRTLRTVRRFRPHFRRAKHRHSVKLITRPTWTIVITGPKTRSWGFWRHGEFVHWRTWVGQNPTAPCQDPE